MPDSSFLELIGQRFGLRVLGKLAEGTFGALYLMEEQRTGRQYGVKLIAPELTSQMPLHALVEPVREAEGILHPNIATTYEIGFTPHGQAYVMREFVPGSSLEWCVGGRGITLKQVVNVAAQTAQALMAAHRREIAHLDIKPNNIILSPNQEVKIVDFGLGRLRRTWEDNANIAIDPTAIRFKAPEQKVGEAVVDTRSDLYSLGAVLYTLVADKTPPTPGAAVSTVPKVLTRLRAERGAQFRVAGTLNTQSARRLGNVIDSLLEPEPQNRITADELVSELNKIIATPKPRRRWIADSKSGGGTETTKIFEQFEPLERSAYIKQTKTRRAATTAGRQVNAWLVKAAPPLVIGRRYKLGVNIGAPRGKRLAGGTFKEPDWGKWQSLNLLVSLAGLGIEIKPTWRHAVLPRQGNMRAIYFQLIPRREVAILHLSIFLRRELTLLEEFRMELTAMKEVAVAAA